MSSYLIPTNALKPTINRNLTRDPSVALDLTLSPGMQITDGGTESLD